MMRNIQVFYLLVCIVLFTSCRSTTDVEGDFKLLPAPQQFDVKGVSSLAFSDVQYYYSIQKKSLPVQSGLLKNIQPVEKASKSQIIYGVDSSLDLKAEGYILEIANKQIVITGKDEAGLFYGFKTLEQLLEDAKDQGVNLPLCSIKDYPLLSYRAIHLDVKHHREKTSYYYDLLDKLAGYKVNAIIVELEDKIMYERQSGIGSADALSIDEWKNLSEYAKERNIEISPLVQGLGHASFILKHDKYKDLRDDPQSDWAFNPLNPKTYDVQFDLYLDAIDATPHGKFLHVGGDEVHTTGRDSGKSALELQLSWLRKVSEFAEKHNRIPIFWDDMPLKQAGVYKPMFDTDMTAQEVDKVWEENEHKLLNSLDLFPKNCIYMRWNYSSSEAIGNGKAMEWFRNHGMKVMGATAGQTRWVLMPQKESNMNNIRAFSSSSIKNDLNGLLLTLWDDDSPHFELYMRGIIAFSEYTWAGDKRSKDEIKTVFRQREFSNELSAQKYAFVDRLEKPVGFWKNALLKGNLRNKLIKEEDPITTSVIDLPNSNNKGKWVKQNEERLLEAINAIKTCDSIASIISEMKMKTPKNLYRLEVYEQVNNLVRYSLNALLALKEYDIATSSKDELEAINKIKKLAPEFKTLRMQFEEVYAKTRVLTKPKNYILDQDHHRHLANQTVNFDWQFYAELLFLEKIDTELIN